MSREPGFNLTDSETGAAIPLDEVSNCSLSSPDVTLTWLPSEPTEASAPGLHILHYDANDQYSTAPRTHSFCTLQPRLSSSMPRDTPQRSSPEGTCSSLRSILCTPILLDLPVRTEQPQPPRRRRRARTLE